MTRVKICGLTRREDAEHALEHGADALGFVLENSSPRCVRDLPELRSWLLSLGPYVTRVAVYGPAPAIRDDSGFDAVQAIRWEGVAPARFIQTVRLKPQSTLEDLVIDPHAEAILIDAHHPDGYGGMGQRVDWDLAAALRELSGLKVILAGGLTPENVREAIERVRPYAVDVSSGVEAEPGIKDHAKVRAFLSAAKG